MNLKSRKLWAAILGLVIIILAAFGLGPEDPAAQSRLAEVVVAAIAAVIGAYTLGQGVADHGKEGVQMELDAAERRDAERRS